MLLPFNLVFFRQYAVVAVSSCCFFCRQYAAVAISSCCCCRQCPRINARKAGEMQFEAVEDLRTVECDQCGKRLADKYSLKKHVSICFVLPILPVNFEWFFKDVFSFKIWFYYWVFFLFFQAILPNKICLIVYILYIYILFSRLDSATGNLVLWMRTTTTSAVTAVTQLVKSGQPLTY